MTWFRPTVLLAALALLVPMEAVAQSCSSGRSLNSGELRAEVAGHRLSGYSMRTKARWTEKLHDNGVTEFTNAKGKTTFGRWRIQGRRLCFSYGTMTEWTCKTVHRVSRGCTSFKLVLMDDKGDVASGIFSARRMGRAQTRQQQATGPRSTELDRAIAREKTWSSRTRAGVQNALIWSGDYQGRADGKLGSGTRKAIKAFQRRFGDTPTGYLTQAQVDRLERVRVKAIKRVGFRVVDDYDTGIRIGIPESIFRRQGDDGSMMVYKSRPSQPLSTLALISFNGDRSDLRALYRELSGPDMVGRSAYMVLKDDWFVISDTDKLKSIYTYVRAEGGTIKGYTLIWPKSKDALFKPIAAAMFNSFETLPGVLHKPGTQTRPDPGRVARSDPDRQKPRSQGGTQRPQQSRPQARGTEPRTVSTGTGFVVHADGHILTNAHVVEGCKRLRLDDGKPARLLEIDSKLDLALIKVDGGNWKRIATFAPTPARLNSDVTVIGYPLHGILGGLNVTRGSISSLTGLKGDKTHFQMSAAVQPGNSGGPVVNQYGAVVGVVQSKLNALRIAKRTGDIPQNINFAIRGEIAKLFVSLAGITPRISSQTNRVEPADLAAAAQEYTVLIRCTD